MRAAVLACAALLAAAPSTAQTLADLLAEPLSCPSCPPPPPPPGWDLVLEVPASGWPPGTRIELEVRPGLIVEPPYGRCGLLSARAVLDGQAAEAVPIARPEGCQPVPEPGVGLGVVAGVVLLAWLRSR